MQILKPQKVLHLKDALALKTPKVHGTYYLTEKLDGWWVAIPFNKESGRWEIPISSNSRQIPSLVWTVDILNKLPKPHVSCYLLAEAIIPDTPFEIINGLLNRSVGNCSCLDVEFKLHNIVFPGINISAESRWRYLHEFDISNASKLLSKVPLLYAGEYHKDIWQHYFDLVVNKGGEGIVAQRETALYMPTKRNADLLKLKLECTIDTIAVRLEETIGEQGYNGLTLVSKRANGTEIRTVIGKHSDQQLFRNDPTSVIGKVVEIKGMEELSDGNLRQPVFRYIRHDKQATDIN